MTETPTDLLSLALDYFDLCAEARKLGVPTSLEDARSPRTIEGLRTLVEAARAHSGAGRAA